MIQPPITVEGKDADLYDTSDLGVKGDVYISASVRRTRPHTHHELNDGQRKALDVNAQKWIKTAFLLGRVDRTHAAKALCDLYASAKLPKPFVRVAANPISVMVAGTLMSSVHFLLVNRLESLGKLKPIE